MATDLPVGRGPTILAYLREHPHAPIGDLAVAVYGEANERNRIRIRSMAFRLMERGELEKCGKDDWEATGKVHVPARGGKKKHYREETSTKIARAARKRGRPREHTRPLFRCLVCSGLAWESEMREHAEWHGRLAHEARKCFVALRS